MASIYKRSNSWTASVSIKLNGQYRKKTKSGFPTKKEAEQWANENEVAKAKGVFNKKKLLFYPTMKKWYEVFKEPKVARATKKWFEAVLKIVEREWPNKPIEDVRSSDFQELLNNYAKTHVKVSTKRVKNIISEFCRYAMDEEYITRDFSRNVYISGMKKSKSADMKFLESKELKKLLARAKAGQGVSSRMIVTACYTGMRYAEIAGLTPDDVDLKEQTISIEKTWDMVVHQFKPTKTTGSVRTIYIPDELVDLFKKWRFGKRFVFEGQDGFPPTNNACNKTLANYLKKDDSKQVTFHALRHTHASYLLAHNISVQYVSERLGHANVNITLGIYAHLLEDKRKAENQRVMNNLNNLNKL
ncbi:site-specific integrase [Fructobacillus sp. CRL 2054]|uniref:site-specific integrase n=1 Tax=Fructobacillus sp. CRL 2054 TaxID=2763007 RepID=UPI00237844F6|nr:site-specific integrase [Fructobacillus sp. CRL 2054]MDD9139177.1 site-specific integrase [Fructobacillus sp. CRL 2054]